jgi:hypothetical protein
MLRSSVAMNGADGIPPDLDSLAPSVEGSPRRDPFEVDPRCRGACTTTPGAG